MTVAKIWGMTGMTYHFRVVNGVACHTPVTTVHQMIPAVFLVVKWSELLLGSIGDSRDPRNLLRHKGNLSRIYTDSMQDFVVWLRLDSRKVNSCAKVKLVNIGHWSSNLSPLSFCRRQAAVYRGSVSKFYTTIEDQESHWKRPVKQHILNRRSGQ